MPAEFPSISDTLREWFSTYRRHAAPNVQAATVSGWLLTCDQLAFVLKREATAADLSRSRLAFIQKRLREHYSESVISKSMRTLIALWRFIGGTGEIVETPPRRNELPPPGRPKRTRIGPFEGIVGLRVTPADEILFDAADPELQTIRIPVIDGPAAADYAAYRREVVGARTAAREETLRLCGSLLFCWTTLYLEWAGLDGSVRNHWRFAMLRFAEFLKHPAELDDLTEANLVDAYDFMVARHVSCSSARLVAAKLRTVWRFAWEAGALESPPPGRLLHRWSLVRLGRPSVIDKTVRCKNCPAKFVKKRKDHCFCCRRCANSFDQRARREKTAAHNTERECPNCGKKFMPTRSDKEYCCHRCASIHGYARRKARGQKICPHCNNGFIPKRSHAVACSRKCREQMYKRTMRARAAIARALVYRSCEKCGATFSPQRRDSIACSSRCRVALNSQKSYERLKERKKKVS